MKLKQYGKPSTALLNQKTSFFEENRVHLQKQREIAAIYAQQPERTNCKNCAAPTDGKVDFEKDGIGYFICDTCSHVNGIYEDTNAFCKAIYTGDDGEAYAKNYSSADKQSYNYRTTSIYLPKAEFLYTTLVSNHTDPHSLSYLDFGAGSGYFVAALDKMGLAQVSGTEVSAVQVGLGNSMIGNELLKRHDLDDSHQILKDTTSNVISMIGVLEHLQEPRETLKIIRHNPHIQYLYLSVPTFSLSVYLELFSPDIYHRQLSGGHTHLYTEESLHYMAKEFGFEQTGVWWFGSDIVDLYRHLKVNLEKIGASKKTTDLFSKDFIPIMDAMQLELDKKHYADEVHILYRLKK